MPALLPTIQYIVMINKLKSLLLLSLFFALIISCQIFSNYYVRFEEINEEGIAIFRVFNNTSKDILSIDFELTYFNAEKEIIKVDTLQYSSGVFLQAEGQTIIAQKVPNKTHTASAKIISTNN